MERLQTYMIVDVSSPVEEQNRRADLCTVG